jgi:LemA protein
MNFFRSFFILRYFKWILGLGIPLLLFLWFSSSYNSIISLEEQSLEKWGQVKTAYQRRFDLIPNLVETVKGSADFEKSTLEGVIAARSQATSFNLNPDMLSNPEQMAAFEKAQANFSGALSRLMVVVEKYPDLKASQQFSDLMVQLEGTENRINIARQDFNSSVKDYNTRIRTFPGNLFAGIFGFEKKVYFEGDAQNEAAPSVGKIFKDKE